MPRIARRLFKASSTSSPHSPRRQSVSDADCRRGLCGLDVELALNSLRAILGMMNCLNQSGHHTRIRPVVGMATQPDVALTNLIYIKFGSHEVVNAVDVEPLTNGARVKSVAIRQIELQKVDDGISHCYERHSTVGRLDLALFTYPNYLQSPKSVCRYCGAQAVGDNHHPSCATVFCKLAVQHLAKSIYCPIPRNI